jgi:hypothetical protein
MHLASPTGPAHVAVSSDNMKMSFSATLLAGVDSRTGRCRGEFDDSPLQGLILDLTLPCVVDALVTALRSLLVNESL